MINKKNILMFLEKQIGQKKTNNNKNLIDSGILDSLNFVILISKIEKKYKIKLSSYDISNKKNFTYEKLASLILKQLKNVS
jgi:acyl carrier protein